MALQPGEIIDGKYRIVKQIGEGGMGAVYLGENTRIKRQVAIKVLHASVAEKVDVVARFEREAQAAGRIGSEHIVEVLDLGSLPSNERFMVMEFLEGEDLTSRIKNRKRLMPHECVPILEQVLDGLGAAHDAQIIHRDLKPDNIFILHNKAGRADFVKILDFGVSKFSALDSEMSMTRTGAVMGTPYYMSPEQAKGGTVDNRSDLYAIGVVLYQMITGRVPFNASSFNELLFKIALESPEPVEQIVPDCPPAFAAIVNKAMAREPEARFQSSMEFKQTLQHWLQTAQQGGQQGASGPYAGMAPTAPMPVMPDMRAPMGSSPMLGQSNPHLGQSNPHLAQSNPQMRGSNPHLAQSNPHMPTQHMPPGGAPGMMNTPYPGGQLGMSQAAMAVTPPPKSKGKTGMVMALSFVTVAVLGLGGVGAYMLTRPASPGETSPPIDTTGDETAPKADPTPEPDEPTTPDPEPTTESSSDPPEPSAKPSAEPKAPDPQPQAANPAPGPRTQPRKVPDPVPVPVPQPPPVQPPSGPKGRNVPTKL